MKKPKLQPIPKHDINELPQMRFQGRIHVISDPERIERAVISLKEHDVLGFDTETRPSFVKGKQYKVSLLQLSTDKEAFLFRVQLSGINEMLKELLEDDNIIKAGVAIRDDLLALQKICHFEPGGFIELADLAQEDGIPERGLRGLAARFLGKRISKGAKLTNWEAKNLTKAQMAYAALDAWAGREIYLNWPKK